MTVCTRKFLCADALISTIFRKFSKVPDPRMPSRKTSMSFTDILMTGFAIFGLKYPSMLQYDKERKTFDQNLKELYHINALPSDTHLRERLDELDPAFIRPAFKEIFAQFQRGKCLEQFEFFDGHYLLALDGTGEFSSTKICCPQCCKKEYQNGSVTYYHQMLGGCIVHPDLPTVVPLCPETIENRDGSAKNDCERNATKRFIQNFKREHPHLNVILLGDGIASNGPYIEMLQKHKMKFLLVAKPGDHKALFEAVESSDDTQYVAFDDEAGFHHQFRFLNGVALNKSHPDLSVNFLEYMETDPKGKEVVFSWVTNIPITRDNVFTLMRGGRSRWKIENETFNTLKNFGYNFNHNYGHGKKYLCTVLCLLTMLSFLVDQVQGTACSLFRAVKKQVGSFRALWEKQRVLFEFVELVSWEQLYGIIFQRVRFNTS